MHVSNYISDFRLDTGEWYGLRLCIAILGGGEGGTGLRG